jgi:ParB-like chromosome segregation protein Spo0J
MGRSPAGAIRGLKVMQAVMPDVDTKAAVQHALTRISAGRVRSPGDKTALAALGRRILNRLNIYRQASPQLAQLAKLKQRFARGELSAADFAGRIGLLTGRFGGTREEVGRMRKFLQEVIARPVEVKGSPLADLYSQDPEMAAMFEKAFARGRGVRS